MAAMLFGHLAAGFEVGADVTFFEDDLLGLEKTFHQLAGEAAGLGEEHDAGSHDCLCLPARYSLSCTISNVIFAVFSSMAETEQYFSFESRTASSTALRETLPPMR